MDGIAIIVGHRESTPGVRIPGPAEGDPATEWAFNVDLAEQVRATLEAQGVRVEVFHHPRGSYASAVRDNTVRRVNRWDPQVVVALHSNAAPFRIKKNRSLALHWPSSKAGKALAAALSKPVAKALKMVNHGPVAQDRSWSRSRTLSSGKIVPAGPYLWPLKSTRAPAAMLETHFMSHIIDGERVQGPDHVNAVTALRDGTLAGAVVLGLTTYLKD